MAAMAECMAWPGRCVGLLAAAAGCWLLIAAPAVSKRWGGVAGRMVMAKIKLRSTRPNTLRKKKVCALRVRVRALVLVPVLLVGLLHVPGCLQHLL